MKYNIQPRMLTMEQVQRYLGVSDEFLRMHRKEWEKEAPFPAKHPKLGRYDIRQIDKWVEDTGMGYMVAKNSSDILSQRISEGVGI